MVEITNRDIDKQWEKILAFHRSMDNLTFSSMHLNYLSSFVNTFN